MNINEIKEVLLNRYDDIDIRTNESMINHTSFKIGGPADLFIVPGTLEQIKDIVSISKQNNIPYFILGNGSNLLVNDDGFRGIIIQIYKNMNKVTIEGNNVTADAGILLSTLAKCVAKAELKGFEYASGIPGTLGGAIYMNAGAYGGEMKDWITEVTAMDEEGNIHTFDKEQLEFGYRTSIFQKKHFFILQAKLRFEKGLYTEINEITMDLTNRRKEKQPLHMPSAGSVFKRPEGYFAGKLIMDSGLRGFSIGGACVSEKHCGFIVNKGGATAKDVVNLIRHVRKTVYINHGVVMEPEIRILGISGLEDIQVEDLQR